ncbi:MAG TPA: hypothetical protein VK642_15200, partial [Burkholderiales bacterium]|nr:hypothetical protein [Burkholderiales bacterium]
VVGAYDRIVFNDGNAAGHADSCEQGIVNIPQSARGSGAAAAPAFLLPQLISTLPDSRPRRATLAPLNTQTPATKSDLN